MPVRIAEKKALVSILLLAAGLYAIITVKLVPAPVHVSEKGIALALAAIVLLIAAVRLFKGAVKQAD